MADKDCSDMIISEEYWDILSLKSENIEGECVQFINDYLVVSHIKIQEDVDPLAGKVLGIPRVYGPYGESSVIEAGFTYFYDLPNYPLTGKGVIIGFVDSGIDYLNEVFVNENNTTKIVSIWDQTIQNGKKPIGFKYGTEYTREDINKALDSEDPYSIVPSRDETGHGTFIAGVAAGRRLEGFTGGAPDSEIVMVKLKQAKEYLRDIYLIDNDAIIYQENDIMLGIEYLMNKAREENKALAICIGIGSNQGPHNGTSNLEEYLDHISQIYGQTVTVAGGNEANLGHHYTGNFNTETKSNIVEVVVAEEEKGISLQIWSNLGDVFSVSILSPTGETIIGTRPDLVMPSRKKIDLFLEETTIIIDVIPLQIITGDEVIVIRIVKPIIGVWTFRVEGNIIIDGTFNIWLDRKDWINSETKFLKPDPYTTVTIPSTADKPITVGAINHRNNSISPFSGRGYTRDNRIKPELVAAGVDVVGPLVGGGYGTMSGTSISAAHVAAATALILQWAISEGNNLLINTEKVKLLLIRGAYRKNTIQYPNKVWGYGSLDLYGAFLALKGDRYI